MTKPSTKKAAPKKSSRRKAARPKATPKPAEVVKTAPEPDTPTTPAAEGPCDVVTAGAEPTPSETMEELRSEIAKFDHDGDGHVGGSLPHSEEPAEPVQEEPETAPVEDAAEQPEATEEAPAADPDQPTEAPETVSPTFEKCMVGPVEARVGRVPVGVVKALLSPDGLRRIEAEKSTASFEHLCKRHRATDGRATPVVFAQSVEQDGAPSILHGFAEIAAAEEAGADDLTVILIPAGGVSEAQAHIAEMVRQQRAEEKPNNDDDLFYRVHAEG
jgi:hypothetical protein